MKLKPKQLGQTTVTPTGLGVVQIHHQQSVKQSADWQSAEAVYGVTINVEDNPLAVQKGFQRAIRLVEQQLLSKISEHKALLASLRK